MSQNYQQYGGNPYGQAEEGYGAQSNPYGGGGAGYGSSNPYGGGVSSCLAVDSFMRLMRQRSMTSSSSSSRSRSRTSIPRRRSSAMASPTIRSRRNTRKVAP